MIFKLIILFHYFDVHEIAPNSETWPENFSLPISLILPDKIIVVPPMKKKKSKLPKLSFFVTKK